MPLALRQPGTVLPLSLADCYQGPLEHFTPPLIEGAVPQGAITASRWRNAALLEEDMARYASRYPKGDTRAIASLWSKWH
ncbi:MAG: siderophore-iron reductase FhuF, partial [Pseudomonadota bacterium]|nr:siderophore-iron reductase FhuF [Pseudomonadota bacterium]